MTFKILFLFLQISVFGLSQELAPSSSVMKIDSLQSNFRQYDADSLLQKNLNSKNEIYPKKFDHQYQTKYKGADFDYTTVKPRESLWQKIQKRIVEILETLFGKVDPNKTATYAVNILRVFALVITGIILYFLIKFLLRKDGNSFFRKKNKKLTISNDDLQENIHEINFKESIADFERQSDYRSAIRYHFLFVLKNLSDQKLISWNLEKTNKDYINELKDEHVKINFQELTHIFNYVWYGDFEIDEERYHLLKVKFSQFKIKIERLKSGEKI